MAAQQSTDEPRRRQIEQDSLAELIDEYTGTEGGFTGGELAAARATLYGTGWPDAGRAVPPIQRA
jgi:hypothetical protein